MDIATLEPCCPLPETWLPVPGFEDSHRYSDHGRVCSIDRTKRCANGQVRHYRGRLLAGYDTLGYRTQRFSRDTAPVSVHVLVLTGFRGPRPSREHEGLHGDRNRANNHLANLRWGTVSDNRQDAIGHRTHVGTNRDRCGRGHLFAGPNLLRRRDGTGHARRCKACTLAKSALSWHRRRGAADFDAAAYANRRYAELMADTKWADDVPRLTELPEAPAVVEPADVRPTDIPGECWLPIPGWEHSHEVSDHARVRSISRWVEYIDGREHWYRGKVFNLTAARGYLVTGLPIRGADGRMRSKTIQVHKLVMLAFHGPTPDGLEILHGDGDGLNACLYNLRFGTRFENAQDMVRHGRTARERQGDTCRWGHRLTAPNLAEWKLPTKTCLACSHAWYHVRTSRYQSSDFQSIADREFRRIMRCETEEDISARTRSKCVRSHDLAPFNLVSSRLPSLYCRACSQAQSAVRFAASKGLVLDVQAVADAKFATLKSAAA